MERGNMKQTTRQHASERGSRIVNRKWSIVDANAFTLIELLVVIAVIAVLLAVLVPAIRTARERAQRIVCLSNLRQLTTAWTAYADDHGGRLVYGVAGAKARSLLGNHDVAERLYGWLGGAFRYPESRAALIESADKGQLWPYIRDIDVYRCPRAWKGHHVTYTTVASANGVYVPGTYKVETTSSSEMVGFGVRVGSTVLRLTRLTDIGSPASRAIFMDQGFTPGGSDFYVHYLSPRWFFGNPPPIPHADGATLSMADGHAEYWSWESRETVSDLPRSQTPTDIEGVFTELLPEGDYQPKSEDGLSDLQRLQRATWGRLGYTTNEDS
jgi:prepilin-type N-terminal cleavage/methylation domain-containing protein/prepilin-type processing-associated H-X9-DG protein